MRSVPTGHVTNVSRFRRPQGGMIGRGPQTEKLYALEHARSQAIEAAARELARVLKQDRAAFWTDTLPEELCNILDTYEKGAALVAAEEYLTRNGYTVTRPEGAGEPRDE